MKRYLNFIGGEFVPPASNGFMSVINPATEEVISEVPESSAEDVRMAADAAFSAKKEWGRLPPNERAVYLRKLAALIRENLDSLAGIITEELGKTYASSKFDVLRGAEFIEYAAEWARRLEGEVVPTDSRSETMLILKQPWGVVAGIIPWNAPVMSMGRKVGPALITGNTIVVKPSSTTPNNAFEFAKLVQQAGIPKGVVNVLSGNGSIVGRELVQNPRVSFVTMTGSVEAGQDIVRNSAENLTKVSLELGGKAPAIVMDDADLGVAVDCVMKSRFFASAGAVCVAAERLYVHEKVKDEFLDRLIDEIKKIKVGDPMQPDVDMGPVSSKSLLSKISGMVGRAMDEGARTIIGGKRPAHLAKGFFYEPTILSGCRRNAEIMRKEIFGPVFLFSTFKTLDEAIELANDCEYGLASSIYTRSISSMMRALNELEAGETYVNRAHGSTLQGYHAGWKKSGIGGDDGKHGIAEYMQTHVAYIQTQ